MSLDEFLEIISKRDYSGSPEDSYIQDLDTFFFHSQMQGKEEDFLQLYEKAKQTNKHIAISPVFEEEMKDTSYNEIPFESLILV